MLLNLYFEEEMKKPRIKVQKGGEIISALKFDDDHILRRERRSTKYGYNFKQNIKE